MIGLNVGAFTMANRNTERQSVCRNDDIIQDTECLRLSVVLENEHVGKTTSEAYWFITEIIVCGHLIPRNCNLYATRVQIVG